MISQKQYDVCFQPIITTYIKVDLLNESDIQIGILEGKVIDGNITINAESDCRRMCDIKMHLENDLVPKKDSKIWLNKRFRIHVGILDLMSDEIVWFDDLGIFILDNPSIDISITENTLSFKGNDKMFLLKGEIGKGLLEDKTTIITYAPLHETIKSIITKLSDEEHYIIEKSNYVVPYTIEKSPTDTCYDLLKEIKDLYMGMEMYYDEKGYFRYNKIKNRINDSTLFAINKNIDVRINSSTNYDFHNVRNYIKVLGKRDDKTGIQVKAISEITDTNSDFHKNKIGHRPLVFIEDKYFTSHQCKVKADYELMLHENLGEEINITLPCLYFLDVNKIIEFKDKKDQGLDGKYLIKSISFGLKNGSTMSISAKKIYN